MSKLRTTLFMVSLLSLVLLSSCTGNRNELPTASAPEAKTSGIPADLEEASSKSSPAGQEETAPIFITFEGTDLNGNTVSQAIFSQSKLTMVNVWATYCNPCLTEMPGLGELAAEYDKAEFQIIGIVSDVIEGNDQSLAENLVEQTSANYTHLLLNESIYYGLLMDVTAVPTTFFIDEDGMLLDTVVGAMKKTAWEDKINGLLESL